MVGVPTSWVWPVNAVEPSDSVSAAARNSSALCPITRSSLASGLLGLVTTATVGPVISGKVNPLGFSVSVANTTALPLGIVSRLVGKLAPLYEARLPNHEATTPADCSVVGDTLDANTKGSDSDCMSFES